MTSALEKVRQSNVTHSDEITRISGTWFRNKRIDSPKWQRQSSPLSPTKTNQSLTPIISRTTKRSKSVSLLPPVNLEFWHKGHLLSGQCWRVLEQNLGRLTLTGTAWCCFGCRSWPWWNCIGGRRSDDAIGRLARPYVFTNHGFQ